MTVMRAVPVSEGSVALGQRDGTYPMFPFTLPTMSSSSLQNSFPTQFASVGSPIAVPVECNSRKSTSRGLRRACAKARIIASR